MLAGYRRVSRVGDRAERLISPEEQADVIRGYAERRGIEVEMLEPELDVSGGKLHRPILDRVLAGIEDGTYSGVIVKDLSRLSRLSLTDALGLIERIESVGGQVISVDENFDASTPAGEKARADFLSLHRMTRRIASDRFAEAKSRAVAAGIWPISVVPIGYRRGRDRHLEPDPTWAPRVRRAFELRVTGASWATVGRLIDRGASGAAKVIGNRVYLGEIHYGEWTNLDAHPPLVERSLWEAAQLDHPRPHRGGSGPSLLAGLCRCTGCRGLLSPDRRAYRCNGHTRAGGRCEAPAQIAKRIIEPYVEAVVLHHIGDVVVTAHEQTEGLKLAEGGLAEAEAELATYQGVSEAAGVDAEFTAEGLRLRVERVEEARRGLAEARLQARPAFSVEIAGAWEGMSVEERRHVLRSTLGVVWVRKGRTGDRVKISTEIPPDLPRSGRERSSVDPQPWDAIREVVSPPPGLELADGIGGTPSHR